MSLVSIPTDLYYDEVGFNKRIMLYVPTTSIKYKILQAIKSGDYVEFIFCYDNMSKEDKEDSYLLTQAARYNREEIFFFLYEQGYRPNRRCLHYIRKSKNSDIISYIS